MMIHIHRIHIYIIPFLYSILNLPPSSLLSFSPTHLIFTIALALSTISSSKAAFICSLTVIVVPLVSFLLYKKPLTASNAISAIIALSGVAVLEGMVNAHQLFGVMPSIAAETIQAVVHGTNALPELINTSNAAGLVSVPIDASTEAISAVTNMNSVESFLSLHKGDLLALGQPIGFGFAFMRIEQYVEKFKDVKNQVLTISAAQCVAVGLLSFLWVLFDYNGHIPNFGYLVSYPFVLHWKLM
jgi:drug/metabolite transporter (DMT)-like permease